MALYLNLVRRDRQAKINTHPPFCLWLAFQSNRRRSVADGPAGDKSWSALRRLHMARRVERSLLSYERSGWLEDTTVVTKHSEIRPSSEMGPIICCLDTSGSMHGARETVAKVALVPT